VCVSIFARAASPPYRKMNDVLMYYVRDATTDCIVAGVYSRDNSARDFKFQPLNELARKDSPTTQSDKQEKEVTSGREIVLSGKSYRDELSTASKL
jgi:hypothetical protein